MIKVEDISNALQQHSKENGYFIVDIKLNNNDKIFVFVDNMMQLPISECVKINRWLRNKFGEELDNYELTVSTPGLDQSFKTIEQYQKNIGKEVEVVQKDGKKIIGKLANCSENQFVIKTEEKIKNEQGKKELIVNELNYKKEEIKSIKVVIKI